MNTWNKRVNQPMVHCLSLHVVTNNMVIVDDNFLPGAGETVPDGSARNR